MAVPLDDTKLGLIATLLDPQTLDIRTFNLHTYLQVVLDTIGRILELEVVIVRRRNEYGDFRPVASIQVAPADLNELDVTDTGKLVTRLWTTHSEYLIADPWTDENYGQHEWAKRELLRQGRAFPLFCRRHPDTLNGFVVYFTRCESGFTSEKQAEIKRVNEIITGIFLFATTIEEIFGEFGSIDFAYRLRARALHLDARDIPVSARYHRGAAEQCLRAHKYGTAGNEFMRAAKQWRKDDPYDREKHDPMIIRDYFDATAAYVRQGWENIARSVFQRKLAALLNRQPAFTPEYTFRCNMLCRVAGEHGFDDLARLIHVYSTDKTEGAWKSAASTWCTKQCRRLGYLFPAFRGQRGGTARLWWRNATRKAVYAIWGITSDYGESWSRFFAWMTLVVFLFACVYDIGATDSHKGGWLDLYKDSRLCEHGNQATFATSMSFSLTVFTTLGFGDITPCTTLGYAVVGLEVLFGYLFLGIFVTILSRKMFRK